MGFSVQIPIPGQPFSSEGVKVGNDISTIAQWGNGHILGTDLDPAAGILASQLDSAALVPTGVVLPFSGRAAIPTGFAVCNGQSLTRSNFPRGFDFATAEVAAGNPLWTVNAGAATFTVPNLLDHFVYASSVEAVGAVGGEASHVLGVAEMPSHNHPTAPGISSFVVYPPAGGPPFVKGSGTAGDSAVASSASTGNTGGGGAHNNMPPYVVLALIVKV